MVLRAVQAAPPVWRASRRHRRCWACFARSCLQPGQSWAPGHGLRGAHAGLAAAGAPPAGIGSGAHTHHTGAPRVASTRSAVDPAVRRSLLCNSHTLVRRGRLAGWQPAAALWGARRGAQPQAGSGCGISAGSSRRQDVRLGGGTAGCRVGKGCSLHSWNMLASQQACWQCGAGRSPGKLRTRGPCSHAPQLAALA